MSTNLLSSIPSLAQLRSLITNNQIYSNENLRVGLFALGASYAFLKAVSLAKNLISPLFQFKRDLAARYGRGSWAVITGASDGIGKGLAFELAKRGFNIVLVARNKEKLEHVVKDLKIAVPTVQTRVVVADFSLCYKEGWAENIHQQVADLDISILVNNAGVSEGERPYQTVSTQEISNVILVNSLSHSLVTRVFLPGLAARTKRGAIINLSSIAGSRVMPFKTTYCATKVFHDFLSRGLAQEHPNLDIISLRPGFISTPMTQSYKVDPTFITVEEFVNVALRKLGYVHYTFGHWRHSIQGFIFGSIPDSIFTRISKSHFNIKI